jgi:hypothetical protein
VGPGQWLCWCGITQEKYVWLHQFYFQARLIYDIFFGLDSEKTGTSSGVWDGIHVFEVENNGRRSAIYKITSTVILDLESKSSELGALGLSGNLTRQTERVMPIEDDASHIANIGTLVEEIESKLRNILNEVYFGKTRDIIGDLRSGYSTGIRYAFQMFSY